ncbi:MAG: hypothetical protein WD552_00680 [Candidatus Paceibacterota bacterium]
MSTRNDRGNSEQLTRAELARRTDELLEKHGFHKLVLRRALAQDKRIIFTPMGNSTR